MPRQTTPRPVNARVWRAPVSKLSNTGMTGENCANNCGGLIPRRAGRKSFLPELLNPSRRVARQRSTAPFKKWPSSPDNPGISWKPCLRSWSGWRPSPRLFTTAGECGLDPVMAESGRIPRERSGALARAALIIAFSLNIEVWILKFPPRGHSNPQFCRARFKTLCASVLARAAPSTYLRFFHFETSMEVPISSRSPSSASVSKHLWSSSKAL